MTEKDFRRIVLALDGAVESAHMGHPDFRAHGRIFATLRHAAADSPAGPSTYGVVMLTPEQQRHVIASAGAMQVLFGPASVLSRVQT